MARWSILKDGSPLNCLEILRSNSFCIDLDRSDDCRNKLRCLFDHVLLVFLREVSARDCIRPIPAMLGDGRFADLFKLFWVVREKGGFDSVSNKSLWALVAEESGLDIGVAASIKLIYVKYLYELDQWLRRVFGDESLGNGEFKCGGNLGLLEAEIRGLLSDGRDENTNDDDRFVQLESKKNGLYIDLDSEKCELHLSAVAADDICNMNGSIEKGPNANDDDEKIRDDDGDSGDVVVLDMGFAKKEFYPQKRKRESLSGMLNWVIQLAKNPGDPSIGTISEGSKWKEHGSKEFWAQALLAREARLLRGNADSDAEQSLLQKKPKMHPSMYEDRIIQQSTEGLRCSKRVPSLMKSPLCPCCKSCSATQSKLASPRKAELDSGPKEQALVTVDLSATSTPPGLFGDDPLQKHVSVGPLFQAEVPDWTGMVSESDSKWLGTRVWPLENGEHNSLIELDPIGKGRQDSCGCRLPGSVDCVRFHIAEKRMKMKLELGLVFYCWRFHRMGEEVSLSWTAEEEKRFKDMVRSNPPSLNNCFWDDAFKCFPTKTRENLVSYHFNVFLVRRRSYQNRVTPKNIDSDDDESEFGSLSGSFGHEAVKVPGSKFLICAQNKQCIDLE